MSNVVRAEMGSSHCRCGGQIGYIRGARGRFACMSCGTIYAWQIATCQTTVKVGHHYYKWGPLEKRALASTVLPVPVAHNPNPTERMRQQIRRSSVLAAL